MRWRRLQHLHGWRPNTPGENRLHVHISRPDHRTVGLFSSKPPLFVCLHVDPIVQHDSAQWLQPRALSWLLSGLRCIAITRRIAIARRIAGAPGLPVLR